MTSINDNRKLVFFLCAAKCRTKDQQTWVVRTHVN